MTLFYILIYIVGFFVTAWIKGPKDANGEEDTAGQTGIALMWPMLAVFFILFSPVFIVEQMNKLRKK
jgi:heme/copper-type cytochrome/quinol oxidase subunit 2